ncbi:hypothetical protein SAMN05192533_12423 [Mesobacillus persicus]|uniref:Uncharacterized protein n=1 Tax=Mesobacillus persicus TaxID=930146 RepID=A0A1H8K380_9BACI|nr:hypothetical protein SAMN05192533_12423 [Mesobacillus persicus]
MNSELLTEQEDLQTRKETNNIFLVCDQGFTHPENPASKTLISTYSSKIKANHKSTVNFCFPYFLFLQMLLNRKGL